MRILRTKASDMVYGSNIVEMSPEEIVALLSSGGELSYITSGPPENSGYDLEIMDYDCGIEGGTE